MANTPINEAEDPRFLKIEEAKKAAKTELDSTYNGMIGQTDDFYKAQIDATKQKADILAQNQQAQTNNALEQIEQQRAQAKQDYTKEQSGAYVDWQKQSDQYGANAERMASSGMTTTGYSETSQVAMYTAYQNRVATAREAFGRAQLNYDNAMKDAMLQNNVALAEITLNAYQTQLELSLEGFQHRNQLILDKANEKTELDNIYYGRYMDVYDQINKEKEFEESVRRYNDELWMQQREFQEGTRQFNEEMARLRENDQRDYALMLEELRLKEESSKAKDDDTGNTDMMLDKDTEENNNNEEKSSNIPSDGWKKEQQENATIDRSSLSAAGYSSTLSEKEIAQLVAAGKLTYTIKGNKIVFRKPTIFEK